VSESDGHQLAVDMLDEIAAHWTSRQEGVPADQIGTHWKRDDGAILRRYLGVLQSQNSESLQHGFFAVLTDYIGSAAADGCVPDLETYEGEGCVVSSGRG
jgi:hypothetical protein